MSHKWDATEMEQKFTAWNTRNLSHIWEGTTYYYSRLPHIHPKGASFFITFNLHGAIPKEVTERLKQAYWKEIGGIAKDLATEETRKAKDNARKRHFINVDKYLDQGHESPHWLKQEEIAKIVKDRIHELENRGWYHLVCYCVMSNHVHLLIDTAIENPEDDDIQPIEKIMQYLKGQTARFANLNLGRTGEHFWQKDYYNRYMRTEEEFYNVISYILNNPVKAGIVEKWEDFPHSFYSVPT